MLGGGVVLPQAVGECATPHTRDPSDADAMRCQTAQRLAGNPPVAGVPEHKLLSREQPVVPGMGHAPMRPWPKRHCVCVCVAIGTYGLGP